ncbi:MAG: acetyl ornithine aminotransferase family protein [Candidatus Tectomicrobia bacterium]|uniref:Acetyl ornithine aminotransferase family protein n=1 Tax=Tectimicrobiota bacterium TaxID=2528274 RepID=A0A932GMG2_UNCTE|nr:acetyl ornithine aminotransferase family protein [Candidatus Tectomicrobia bacterium]
MPAGSAKPYPFMKIKPPGPKARTLVNLDSQFVSQSYTRNYPLVADRGEGAMVVDVDGNCYLDFTAGIAVCATGHSHPKVVEAITRQAKRLIHMSGTDFYYSSQIALARKLSEIAPGRKPKKVFFGNSGAEAIEAAFKLARYHTKRTMAIAFYGAFHGRTMGALSLTASKTIQRKSYIPLVPGVVHVPYAYCYRCDYNLTYPSCRVSCVDWIKDSLFRSSVPPEEVAAIFVEPIQGEGGYIVPPPEFHAKLHQIARDHGILYVVDEVQSGMGRTGKMFAIEHFGVEPDIIAVAKGIASGLPLGAMIATADIMDWTHGSHASTFGGNPVSCEAALATIELLENGLLANAATMGDYLIKGLMKLQPQHPLIGDIRGKGLMIGIELVKDRSSRAPAIDERNRVVQGCFERGLLVLGCGQSTVRFSPPLIIDQEDADIALGIFSEVLAEVEKGVSP